MTSLPEDIIISILVKLQVKPLMRFRCVCKWWYHLIKSPDFIKRHQRSAQNNRNESILIKRKNINFENELSFYSYESLNEIPPNLEVPHLNDYNFQVSWPCNGLLFCVSKPFISDPDDDDDESDYRSKSVLFNPATRESKLLPPSPLHVPRQNRWNRKIGLGFDSNQNDYKVINIEYEDKAQMYTLSSNSWRQIEHIMPYIYQDSVGVPLNGVLHWPANRKGTNIILSFDVSTVVFQDIKLPEVIARDGNLTAKTITLLDDCLAMFTFDIEFTTFVGIWVMKEGSWMKQIKVVKDILVFPHLYWKNEAIICHDCGPGHGVLKLLDLDTHEITETGISHSDLQPSVMLYKESLVSIN